eukprot:6199236-Pleurochrysis_carterae.AAC.3
MSAAWRHMERTRRVSFRSGASSTPLETRVLNLLRCSKWYFMSVAMICAQGRGATEAEEAGKNGMAGGEGTYAYALHSRGQQRRRHEKSALVRRAVGVSAEFSKGFIAVKGSCRNEDRTSQVESLSDLSSSRHLLRKNQHLRKRATPSVALRPSIALLRPHFTDAAAHTSRMPPPRPSEPSRPGCARCCAHRLDDRLPHVVVLVS